MSDLPQVHVVTGPTASGKTAFAIDLAGQLNGELINLDSRQIYKYLDIGTNKGKLTITNEELRIKQKSFPIFLIENADVPIYLTSFLDPDHPFSAFAFRELVYAAIDYIQAKGKVPILVGGSGLYLNVLLYPQKYSSQQESRDKKLRNKLNKLTKPELQQKVQEMGQNVWETLNTSDRENPHRLIRAIERAQAVNRPVASEVEQKFEFVNHYIDLPMDELEQKINVRVDQMFAAGLVDEVRKVLEMGYKPTAVALQGLGYREVLDYIDGKLDLEQCIQRVKIVHRQYAKRQKTWFKKFLP